VNDRREGAARPTADAREQSLTHQVVASFAGANSERFRTVLTSLVRHAHDFVREVGLTQDEWQTSIDFLTRTGQITDDRRQEYVLLSDVLGISMLTVAVNEPADPNITESTVLGPFFVSGSPHVELGADISGGAVGQPCRVSGAVRDVHGRPIVGARMEIWEADEDGFYDVQYDTSDGVQRTANRAHLFTGTAGEYRFWSVRPAAYPIPADGPVGQLLGSAGRGPMRPAHIHFMISAPGCRTLTTHVFAAGDEYLDNDAVFGVKPSLIAEFVEHPPDGTPPGRATKSAWCSLDYDFVLGAGAPE
jgi:hydroxyquinol 1,2-dioxygenase